MLHRARGLLQEFFANGPDRPASEQEWPPLQQGELPWAGRMQFKSPALARMGLKGPEDAMPGVVGHREWRCYQTPAGHKGGGGAWAGVSGGLQKISRVKVDIPANIAAGRTATADPSTEQRLGRGRWRRRRRVGGTHLRCPRVGANQWRGHERGQQLKPRRGGGAGLCGHEIGLHAPADDSAQACAQGERGRRGGR